MSSSNGSERPAEELVVVRVDDEINQALAGHGGRSAAVALARARRSRGRARARTAALHDRRMKRRHLERHLRAHGCRIIDEGSNHTRWGGPRRARSVMPRHREIDYGLARKICKDLNVPPPSGARRCRRERSGRQRGSRVRGPADRLDGKPTSHCAVERRRRGHSAQGGPRRVLVREGDLIRTATGCSRSVASPPTADERALPECRLSRAVALRRCQSPLRRTR